jgi:hypothetical protein
VTLPEEAGDAERAQLLDELAGTAARLGWQAFVRGRIVAGTPEHFPEPWRGGVPSVRRLLRRVAWHAGMEEAQLRVEACTPEHAGVGPPLLLADVRGSVGYFVVDLARGNDPFLLLLLAVREVVRWRLTVTARGTFPSEREVDLSAMVLGFGPIVADATFLYGREPDGRRSRTPKRWTSVSLWEAVTALAVQLRLRTPTQAERFARTLLQPNQAHALREALDELPAPDTLRAWLHLPDAEVVAPPVAEAVQPLPDDSAAGSVEEDAPAPESGIAGLNVGKSVFRVQGTWARRLARGLALPILALGGVAAGRLHLDISMGAVVGVAAAVGIAGALIGVWFRDERCSDPRCMARLAVAATQCPRCGGTIQGTIRHARERLAAEEGGMPGPSGAQRPQGTTATGVVPAAANPEATLVENQRSTTPS